MVVAGGVQGSCWISFLVKPFSFFLVVSREELGCAVKWSSLGLRRCGTGLPEFNVRNNGCVEPLGGTSLITARARDRWTFRGKCDD